LKSSRDRFLAIVGLDAAATRRRGEMFPHGRERSPPGHVAAAVLFIDQVAFGRLNAKSVIVEEL
jgi:hypothetical protein